MAGELTVKVEPFGPEQRAIDRIERDVRRHPAARELIGGDNRRLLSVEPLEPARRSTRGTATGPPGTTTARTEPWWSRGAWVSRAG
jgi:hypothetical protein